MKFVSILHNRRRGSQDAKDSAYPKECCGGWAERMGSWTSTRLQLPLRHWLALALRSGSACSNVEPSHEHSPAGEFVWL